MDIKVKRKELGFKQKQIAQLCEIEQSYYSKIECGKQKPSVKLAKKLAVLLQTDWTEFFD